MSIAKILLSAEQVIGLIRIGVAVKDAIVGKVKDGAIEVRKDGSVQTAEEVAADIDAAEAAALATGDAAADRIAGRAQGDGDDGA